MQQPLSFEGLRAEDLAKVLGTEIMDAEDAARYLGIAKNSVDYAMYRGRLSFVKYGPHRLLTRADLENYAAKRGRGRDSRLDDSIAWITKA